MVLRLYPLPKSTFTINGCISCSFIFLPVQRLDFVLVSKVGYLVQLIGYMRSHKLVQSRLFFFFQPMLIPVHFQLISNSGGTYLSIFGHRWEYLLLPTHFGALFFAMLLKNERKKDGKRKNKNMKELNKFTKKGGGPKRGHRKTVKLFISFLTSGYNKDYSF